MLVIISDLHLTDGTSGNTIREGAFRAFRERLRDLAYDASWRAPAKEGQSARYEPIDRLDLVLLGDILDVIRSTKWPAVDPGDEGFVRPWHVEDRDRRQLFQDTIQRINDAILANNAESLKVLRSLTDKNQRVITLPAPTPEGGVTTVSRDPKAKERLPVDVDIHYMVGNHDWFYCLPGEPYNGMRQSVVDAMGLSNPPTKPFPHDPVESRAISKIFNDHQIFARHGDVYDPFNFEKRRDASSLGDAIVIDLLNRFPTEVATRLGKDLPQETLDGLKELDNARPLFRIPTWIEGLLARTCSDPKTKREVKEIWNELADNFLKLDFVRKHDTWRPGELADKLQAGLKFSTLMPLAIASTLAGKFGGLFSEDDFAKYALRERACRNRKARFIVYGHTHHHEIVPLDISYTNKGRFDQIYINSGTWRRVHELAQQDPSEKEFVDWNVMTYLAFFKKDERRGRLFETWSGALGVPR